MDQICTHTRGDIEHLLLDDENLEATCLKCRKNLQNQFADDHVHDYSGKLIIEEPLFCDSRTDISEDSPLLVNGNDCFRENFNDAEFHCHKYLSSSEDPKALRKLLMASTFCFIFMLAELVGGYLAKSLAVMTDAAHLFSDFIGFIISVVAIFVARKSPNKLMTFGYYRAEVLGAFLSVLTIWFLAAVFLVLSFRRLYTEDYNVNANTMIIVATIGLLVNIIMGTVLHGVCHTHNHGPIQASSNNINVRAATAHVLGDLLQSFGVLIAAIIIKIFPNAQAADPICTLIFSVIIICTTVQVAKDSVLLLMQGSPVTCDKISLELTKISGVRHVHDLNVWSIVPGKNIVTAHLAVDDYCDRDVVIQNATTSVNNQIPIFSCTIQVESYNMEAVTNCQHCKTRDC